MNTWLTGFQTEAHCTETDVYMLIVAENLALAGGYLVYGALRATIGIRLDAEEEYEGADLTIHKITATPDRETHW